MDIPGTTAETPRSEGSSFSLANFRATRETPSTPVPATETPAAVDDAPDTEVDSDPDFRAAVDELEKPADNETPQQKAARTKKNKEAARKGYQTRLANKAARLERENAELRRTATPPPADRTQPPPAAANQPARPQAEIDPSDPKPTFDAWAQKHPFDAFAAEHPNLADPYAAWQAEFHDELTDWKDRERQRAAEARQRDASTRQQVERATTQLQKHRDAGSAVHPDFESTFAALAGALKGHPADAVIFTASGAIADDKVGSEVLYRLGKHLDETRAAIAGGRDALLMHIGQLKADITAEAKAKAAAPVVTSAPPPHQPVAGASAGGSSPYNPSRPTLAGWRTAKASGTR